MSLLAQIMWGSLFLGVCAAVHVVAIGLCAATVHRLAKQFVRTGYFVGLIYITSVGFLMITASHTIQVWIWAKAFLLVGVIEDLNSALYFALVTYSTVGYGDLTLGPGSRIFGTMAGVTGVLTLGVSTAFLVALIGRTLPGFLNAPEDHDTQ